MTVARPTLAVVGATGAVGTVMLEILSTREDVWGEIRLLASARSAGRVLRCRGEDLVVEELSESSFEGVDVAMFTGRRSRPPRVPSWSTTPARSGWTPRCRSSCPR
jgi:aspartate-semialdehyde dehydrogenase